MDEHTAREKMEFVREEPRPGIDVPRRLAFRPVVDAGSEREFLGVVAAALAGSLDRADRKAVAELGADEAARRYLNPDETFAFDRGWWHLAYAADGAPVGFTQPVIFRGCARDGLEEGTLRHVAVVAFPARAGLRRRPAAARDRDLAGDRGLARLLRHRCPQRPDDPLLRAGRLPPRPSPIGSAPARAARATEGDRRRGEPGGRGISVRARAWMAAAPTARPQTGSGEVDGSPGLG
jgi:hypothetical protein